MTRSVFATASSQGVAPGKLIRAPEPIVILLRCFRAAA
jgi:hypothetical protein